MKVVVIGGGAAGSSAASRAKKTMPNSEVYLLEETNVITHAPCGIPYAIGGLSPIDKLFVYSPEKFEKERGIRVLTNTKVEEIDIDKQAVTISRNGRVDKIVFDKLIIATGAKPIKPIINGVELEGVETIRHPAFTEKLREKINRAHRIIVVGGGYIGIEITENLLRLGKKVLVIEKLSLLMEKVLDKEIALLLTEEVKREGAELHLEESLVEINSKDDKLVVATDKNEYVGDMVILALGVTPNNDLAKKAGIPLGVSNAIVVNKHMETLITNIYAAGDVAEKTNKITGEKTWVPLAPAANKEGYVAGNNAALGNTMVFPGIIGTSITKFNELYIGRTGLTEKEATSKGISVKAKLIKHHSKAHYYPGGSEVYVKLVVRNSDDVIIGAQVAGYTEAVAGYLDALSIAIDKSMSIEELFFADLGYMPAVAPVWHPLVTVARVLLKE